MWHKKYNPHPIQSSAFFLCFWEGAVDFCIPAFSPLSFRPHFAEAEPGQLSNKAVLQGCWPYAHTPCGDYATNCLHQRCKFPSTK